ncbi:chloride channel CLIC-like protein 1 [Montipora capricornis]|uniref:chloride channel CLIC-like protein 1 n=1 Tax=Montipora capricornis TaxID=246305 RepID=UPI0035F1E606
MAPTPWKMKLRFALFVLSLSFLFPFVNAGEHFASTKTPEKEEWLDPGDMIRYDPDKTGFPKNGHYDENKQAGCGRTQTELSQCQRDLKKMPQPCQPCSEKTVVNASSCDTPYFKKVARILLGNIKDYGAHEVIITASEDDAASLEKFVISGDGNVHDVCEVIMGVISNFKGKDDIFDFSNWGTSHVFFTSEALLFVAAFILVICAAVIFEKHTNLTWRSQVWLVLFWCFVISIPWEWYHLYRKSFATKQAEMEKDIPKECRPDNEVHPFDYFKLWFTNTFTFSQDPCVKYQETLLVDPMWEVSPSRAISATLASIVAQPFEHIAEAIGKSFRALFREVPVQWQPFVFIAVILIIIIGMFTISGMQVRLPFVTIATVPALPGNFQANLKAIENQVVNVRELVDGLNEAGRERDANERVRERQIVTLLNALNEEQKERTKFAIQESHDVSKRKASGPVESVDLSPVVEEKVPKIRPVQASDKTVTEQDAEESAPMVEDIGFESKESEKIF